MGIIVVKQSQVGELYSLFSTGSDSFYQHGLSRHMVAMSLFDSGLNSREVVRAFNNCEKQPIEKLIEKDLSRTCDEIDIDSSAFVDMVSNFKKQHFGYANDSVMFSTFNIYIYPVQIPNGKYVLVDDTKEEVERIGDKAELVDYCTELWGEYFSSLYLARFFAGLNDPSFHKRNKNYILKQFTVSDDISKLME